MDVSDNKEPGKWLSAFQALLIVLLFLFLLAWSLSWKLHSPPISPPQSIAVFEIPTPAPPEPKKKVQPPKKSQPPKKDKKLAEIALEKKRKEREEKERKKRDEKERKEREEREKEKRKKREEEKRKKLEKKKREEALLAAQKAKAAADTAAAAAARATQLANLQEIYKGRIVDRIKSHLKTPISVKDKSIIVVISFRLTADGEAVGFPEIEESSGYPEYDESAFQAVLRATPLPMPKEPELIKEFQSMTLRISSKDW